MDYVRILYTYIVEDFMYSGYLLLTLLLPCLIYQGLMEIKAKQNSKILFWSLCNARLSVGGI